LLSGFWGEAPTGFDQGLGEVERAKLFLPPHKPFFKRLAVWGAKSEGPKGWAKPFPWGGLGSKAPHRLRGGWGALLPNGVGGGLGSFAPQRLRGGPANQHPSPLGSFAPPNSREQVSCCLPHPVKQGGASGRALGGFGEGPPKLLLAQTFSFLNLFPRLETRRLNKRKNLIFGFLTFVV
jgi:hypothetical protein